MKAASLPSDFDRLCEELPLLPWLALVSSTESFALALPYRFATGAAEATALASGIAWEDWALEQRNTLTAFLSVKHQGRDIDWNPIAKEVRAIVEDEMVPAAERRLLEALPDA